MSGRGSFPKGAAMSLHFTIKKQRGKDKFPKAHTCSRELDMSENSSKAKLIQNLNRASFEKTFELA